MRRILSVLCVLAFVVCLPTHAWARTKIYGLCQGAPPVSVAIPGTQGSGSQRFEQAYPSCTITLYYPGTVTLIPSNSVYSDESGTVKGNPFTASTSTQWFAYLDVPDVDVKFSGGGIPAPFTIGDYISSPNGYVTSFGAKCDGVTNDAAALSLASTALNVNGGNLVIPGGRTCVIGANTATGANVNLVFESGAKLSVSTTFTVTINGPITAAPTNIFTGAATTPVSFGLGAFYNGSVAQIPIEWFGGVGDWNGATGTDNSAAIQKAANSIPVTPTAGEVRTTNIAVPPITFGASSYLLTACNVSMVDQQYTRFAGVGPNVTFLVLSPSSTADCIKFSSSAGYRYGNGISNMSIAGNNANVRKSVWASLQSHFLVENVWFGTSAAGNNVAGTTALLYLDGMIGSFIYNSRFDRAAGDGLAFGTENVSTTTQCVNCSFDSNVGAGFNIKQSATITIEGGYTESNGYGGRCSGTSSLAITAVHFEANLTNGLYDNDAVNVCRISSTANYYIGLANGADTLFNFDQVIFKSQGDVFVSDFNTYSTTANTIVQQLSDSQDLSATNHLLPTGLGSVQTSGMPMPVLKFYDQGNVTGSIVVQTRRGGLIKMTLTGDTAIALVDTTNNLPNGTQLSFLFVQDGSGGHTLSFNSGGTDFTVNAPITNVGNAAAAVYILTVNLNGTTFNPVANTGWVSASTGYPINSSSGTARVLTDLSITNQLTVGAALDNQFGIKYAGQPTLISFISGSAIDWIGSTSQPHRAGTAGIAIAGWDRTNVDSGTQTTAYGRLITTCPSTTNCTLLKLGADVLVSGNQGIYDDSGFAWNIANSSGGIVINSPTGGLKAGGINISGDLYKNNTAYTNPDYAFEHFYTGSIKKFASNPGAKTYKGLMPLPDLRKFTKSNYSLPDVHNASGMFERGDVVLEKLEEAYLYIFQLNDRIEKLEKAMKEKKQ